MYLNQLEAIMPLAKGRAGEWLAHLNLAMAEFGIVTTAQQAAFMATVAHESAQLRVVVENLNYAAAGLRSTFPRYFPTDAEATRYSKQPAPIANRVYADRMGNGPTASGDGFRYRGRGLIQITGRDNYAACGAALDLDLLAKPELLEQPPFAARSAAWFWSTNNINRYADAGDFDGVCDCVNRGRKTAAVGDSIGWADRLATFNLAKEVLT